jgi:hypothetical protein
MNLRLILMKLTYLIGEMLSTPSNNDKACRASAPFFLWGDSGVTKHAGLTPLFVSQSDSTPPLF